MCIYDITRPIIDGMAVWPGDPEVLLRPHSRIEEGAEANVSRLVLGTHTGTHVDAPAHLWQGASGVDSLPLEALIGPAWVVRHVGDALIGARDLQAFDLPPNCRRILLATTHTHDGQQEATSYAALSGGAAAWLVAHGMVCVGIDGPSVDPPEAGAGPAHRALLGGGVVIIEGLDLHQITPGPYELLCLPLKLRGADGAPARALLVAR